MGTLNPGLFSSSRDEWGTPPHLFNALNDIFIFTLDPCASDLNHKTPVYFTREQDGLSRSWHEPIDALGVHSQRVFVNPPYGKHVAAWVAKAAEEHEQGVDAVCLLPARTDTIWFQKYCPRHVLFLRGRLCFELPCAVCGVPVTRRYRLPTQTKDDDPIPFCTAHAPAGLRAIRNTAPFPTCLFFYLRAPYDLRPLKKLGRFVDVY